MSRFFPSSISGLVVDYDPQHSAYTDIAGTTFADLSDDVVRVTDRQGRFGPVSRNNILLDRPTLKQDANGWKYLEFAVVDNLYSYLSPVFTLAQPCTTVLLHRNPGNGTIFGGDSFKTRAGYPYEMRADSLLSSAYTATADVVHVFLSVWDGTSSVLRLDSSETTGDPGSRGFIQLSMNGHSGGTGGISQDVYRFMAWDRALTLSERSELSSYLSARYNSASDSSAAPRIVSTDLVGGFGT